MKLNGEGHYLWRAVDHESEVLESFVTKMRDKKAALKFLRKAMDKHGRPEVVVTDRLRSYGAALTEIDATARQETAHWLNNRAENTHLPLLRLVRIVLPPPAKEVRAIPANEPNGICALPQRIRAGLQAAGSAGRTCRPVLHSG